MAIAHGVEHVHRYPSYHFERRKIHQNGMKKLNNSASVGPRRQVKALSQAKSARFSILSSTMKILS